MTNITPDHIKSVYNDAEQIVSETELMAAFDKLAAEMKPVLKDANPIFLCVMNGGLMAMSELAKRLHFPLQFDHIHVTRYRGKTSGGTIHWSKEPCFPLKDRTVVVIDDVLDGGVTLQAVVDYCNGHHPKKLYTVAMLDKPEGRTQGGLPKADFTGLEIPNKYVFGFGLDYYDYLRNVPGIYAVDDKYL